ncbi:MAG: hypothetical protein SFX73_03190 [Kofleriaceae bacterium]|nr:hypothetical protein [Kofleriaceae bacterium]
MDLVIALRRTAERLDAGSAYQWGHLGMCNCGHLVETVCGLPPAQIHRIALEGEGDWEQLANAYCPTSGYLIDDLITRLLALGLTTRDIGHLEKLDDPRVLARLEVTNLRRNERGHVVRYLRAWAELLEGERPQPLPMTRAA